MIGFAGARVIQQATYETLPEGFQTAEFLWQHGMIDLVVRRPELPAVLRQLFDLYVKNEAAKVFELEPQANASAPTPAVRGGPTTDRSRPRPGSKSSSPAIPTAATPSTIST